MAANKLEQAAAAARSQLIPLNDFNNVADANNYSQTHADAISDGDKDGKGTGTFMDTNNGGSDIDINGNPTNPGSGRIQNIVTNEFNAQNTYQHPDLSNSGITIID